MGKFKRNNSRKFKTITKVRKPKKKAEVVNKKSIYNRYKNKQQVEQEIEKKRRFDHQLLQKQQITVSESEEDEDDTFSQLVSGFKSGSGDRTKVVESDSELESINDSIYEHEDGPANDLIENNSDKSDIDEPLSEDEVVKAMDTSEEGEDEDSLDDDMPENYNEDDEPDLTKDDPFTKHLEYDLSNDLLVTLASSQPTMEQSTKEWPTLGQLIITIPQPVTSTVMKKAKHTVSLLEEKTYAPLAKLPHCGMSINFNELHIKTQIRNNIASANIKNLVKRELDLADVLTPLQKELFSIINNYQDLYCPLRNFSNADEIRFTYCLHVVNHMIKSRTKILHHNAKLSKKVDSNDEYRDQGLVRPKVIIMVPFKDSAYRVVKTLIDILVPKESGQVINKNRFEDEFTGGEIAMPKKNPKPEDYELLFCGNTDDTFRLGMTITKKTLKLYTEFYSSDIIVASPLGLRMIVGAEGEEERDYDFLSSIELLVMDQADVFLMQNWDHVLHVLDHFHLQPKKTHGTDFSRVRSWAVNGWSKYYRQTLLFSSVALPDIRALVNKKCHNYAGKVLLLNSVETGSIRQIIVQIPQIFHRINASSPLQSLESRFDYFVKEVLPKQRDPLMSHTLIYVPSYFDFVRLRNHLKKEDIGFVQICEYSKDGKTARARDMFFHSEAHFLLYSERAHFFRRLRLKGARHVIFYQPPTYPHFYSEICNLMQECNQNKYGGSECNMSVTVLYSKYDAQQLAAILGTERASAMLRADKHVHMYVTGD